jgi:hypothetical protein
MKIEEKRLKEIKDIIEKSGILNSIETNDAELFFPIEIATREEETDSGVILLETMKRKEGFERYVKPGFTTYTDFDENKKKISKLLKLSYVSTEYIIPFDIEQYTRLSGNMSLTEEEKSIIFQLECYIVKKSQIILISK